jgi:hypothetical protein
MFEDFLSANNMHACQDALVYLRFDLPRNPVLRKIPGKPAALPSVGP